MLLVFATGSPPSVCGGFTVNKLPSSAMLFVSAMLPRYHLLRDAAIDLFLGGLVDCAQLADLLHLELVLLLGARELALEVAHLLRRDAQGLLS
jgi:hypothetical protein